MRVKRLTDTIADELNDNEPGYEHTHWPLPQLIEYITEAMELLASLKPELFAHTINFKLQPGALQRVPAEIAKLTDIPVNTDKHGNLGEPILPASYVLARYFNKPDCMPQLAQVVSFKVDVNNPRVFYVSPPAPDYPPQYVQVLGQAHPPAIAGVDTDIEFSGGNIAAYVNAIKDWALYRAYMKDTESQGSLTRAAQHYKSFYQGINITMQVMPGRSGVKRQPTQAGQRVQVSDADI